MSDINLLLFGCAVSFIAVAGVYVYIRECITVEEPPGDLQVRSEDPVREGLREPA